MVPGSFGWGSAVFAAITMFAPSFAAFGKSYTLPNTSGSSCNKNSMASQFPVKYCFIFIRLQ